MRKMTSSLSEKGKKGNSHLFCNSEERIELVITRSELNMSLRGAN
jgi:hypothetical protein